MKVVLVLEDGHGFSGQVQQRCPDSIGKVILNTAVVGYQEMLTDPANAGKILALTYPLIGNYGCAPKFNESKRVWAQGLVIKERSRITSNWQAKEGLIDFAKKNNLAMIEGIDTRSLAVHLRQKGEMLGIISAGEPNPKTLLAKIEAYRKEKSPSILAKVSLSKAERLGNKKAKVKIALLDLGITQSLIRQLEALGSGIEVLPYDTSPKDILQLKPDGLIVSNGPEEDPGLDEVAKKIKSLLGRLPILGISCGMHVLANAMGARSIKMKLGHRGVNYPMARPATYKGEITAQNHAVAIDPESFAKIKEVKITGYNLNDRSIEEIESKKLRFIGTQYLPASPGFNEINPILKRFVKML